MERPIFTDGYRPLTFEARPRTRREGGEDRMRESAASVIGEILLRCTHTRNSSSVSIGLLMRVLPSRPKGEADMGKQFPDIPLHSARRRTCALASHHGPTTET